MAKSKYALTEKQINKRINEGRGAGRLSDYKPCLYISEVPSEGRSQRVYSHLTGRIHHVLSDLEFAVFLLLDHNSAVTDIREQSKIAHRCNEPLTHVVINPFHVKQNQSALDDVQSALYSTPSMVVAFYRLRHQDRHRDNDRASYKRWTYGYPMDYMAVSLVTCLVAHYRQHAARNKEQRAKSKEQTGMVAGGWWLVAGG